MSSSADRAEHLTAKMQDRRYRRGYVSASNRRFMAAQIRAMREARGWSQGDLAKRLGKPQSVVSRLENPNYGRVTLSTMLEIADAFDVALFARFVSFPKFIRMSGDLGDNARSPASFAEMERK